MHDLDHISQEFENEFELEGEQEYEYDGALDSQVTDDEDEFEFEFELGDDHESPFTEDQEMELASELLNISSEEELDEFLGKAFKKIGRGFKRVIKSPVFRRIGGVLKKVAKKALPIVGGAAGTFFGGPVGGAIGSKIGGFASRLFEMELEGMSPEDQEFEVARRYVRLVGATAANAAKMQNKNMSPNAIAKNALKEAAKQHAPGLLKKTSAAKDKSGRWTRRGTRIIIYGV